MLDGPSHMQNAWLQLAQADRAAGPLATTEERYASAQAHGTLALTCAVIELVRCMAASVGGTGYPRADWDMVLSPNDAQTPDSQRTLPCSVCARRTDWAELEQNAGVCNACTP
jgi:hypothetical protein